MKKNNWQKVVTREFGVIWATYTIDAYKIMKKVVGTTLKYNLFSGQERLLSIYRKPNDVKNSYKMIEKICAKKPGKALEIINGYSELIKKFNILIGNLKKTKNQEPYKKYLLELDQIFLQIVCRLLFVAFLGYAGNLPLVSKFLKKYGKLFNKVRMYTIDTDIYRLFPELFGKINKKIKNNLYYMSRSELINAVKGKKINWQKVLNRRKKYLIIMKPGDIKEYGYFQVDNVLKKELSHLGINKSVKIIKGQSASIGKVTGKTKIILTESDYKKIKTGDIVVTTMTKPSIVPYLKKVKAIITNDGGALSHASIISREMNIPCIVGTIYATEILKDGNLVEVDADKGIVRKI